MKSKNLKKGFTLIELIVVAAIFTVLTAIIIFNYGDFTDNVLSTNMAYEIALTARQAQVFGLGVRGTGGQFSSPYGIFINLDDGSSSDGTKNIVFFADTKPAQGNGQCNDVDGTGYCVCTSSGAQTDECLEQLTLQRNIIIDDLQVKSSGGSCSPTDRLAVSFKRPNPDAIIVDQENGGSNYELAEIRIDSPRSDAPKYVIIRNTGQISVSHNSSCF